jgi:Alpha-kinase family
MKENGSYCVPTSTIPFRESEHGRLRRRQRGIDKKDLQAAMKYGKRTKNKWPHKRCPTSRYYYKDITYIVNDYTGEEVTSYAKPLILQKVPATATRLIEHDKAQMLAWKDPNSWTSNTVIVVDTSGSMRESDVWGTRDRLGAVWVAIALDFIAHQLETGNGRTTDIVSIITLGENPCVVIEEMPCTWFLYNVIVDVYNCQLIVPSGHGPFIPSLQKAEELLTRNMNTSCALGLIFLSDGAPSDCSPSELGTSSEDAIMAQIGVLSSKFGRRLTFTAIGIGDKVKFNTLKAMVEEARDYDVKAELHLPSLTSEAIGGAFTSTVTSTMETQLEITNVQTLKQQHVRNVSRESKTKASIVITEVSHEEFWIYGIESVTRRIYKEKYVNDKWVNTYDQMPLHNPKAKGVAMSKKPFGEGAERFAYRFFELDSDLKTIVGRPMVAKENRFLIEADGVGKRGRKEYVQRFCKTQQKAAWIATAFNCKLNSFRGVDANTPRIQFLDCSIYELNDVNLGLLSVLVEEKLDHTKWKKWNSNNGFIDGIARNSRHPGINLRRLINDVTPVPDLGILEERIDEDEEEDVSDEKGNSNDEKLKSELKYFSPGDIAQAFSHFSYHHSRKKRLVCDLQGVFDHKTNILQLSDPVIHYYNPNKHERRYVHGRTDRGRKGIYDFFYTHNAVHGHLCRLMLRGFNCFSHS